MACQPEHQCRQPLQISSPASLFAHVLDGVAQSFVTTPHALWVLEQLSGKQEVLIVLANPLRNPGSENTSQNRCVPFLPTWPFLFGPCLFGRSKGNPPRPRARFPWKTGKGTHLHDLVPFRAQYKRVMSPKLFRDSPLNHVIISQETGRGHQMTRHVRVRSKYGAIHSHAGHVHRCRPHPVLYTPTPFTPLQ